MSRMFIKLVFVALATAAAGHGLQHLVMGETNAAASGGAAAAVCVVFIMVEQRGKG